MSDDDILDSMSLSDDELLDSLADDLLLEMENDTEETEVIETVQPVRAPPRRAPAAPAFPLAPASSGAGGMPNLGQMMQQMMPMMSQMLGGGGGGMRNPSALQQPKLPWDEVVRQNVPHNEQSEWLDTIRADERKQREDLAAKRYNKPSSRSYHGDAKPLPNVYMETETLLASMLNEAVRAKKAEHNPTWKQYHENLVSHLTQSGLAGVFTREFKEHLRRRVASDPDYAATRALDPKRFTNIATALQV